MPRSSPVTMTFPPFEGAVRKLVLANLATFFVLALLAWIAPGAAGFAVDHLLLQPFRVAHGEIWQLATYSFLEQGILAIVLNMLSLWLCGSFLEGVYGSRWLTDLYFASTIGGALIASAISFTGVRYLSPQDFAGGAIAGIFGILVAIAVRFGDLEILFLIVRIPAKYLVAIYILVDIAILLKHANAFGALLELSGTLCGYLYVRFAPRRGLAFGLSEQFFGLRNAYYRSKRRRAARKFEVYMGKQGRQVHFDKEGRYVDPDEHKDPNDKRWMN
jgi:membrane associated rhomboid family serine protease